MLVLANNTSTTGPSEMIFVRKKSYDEFPDIFPRRFYGTCVPTSGDVGNQIAWAHMHHANNRLATHDGRDLPSSCDFRALLSKRFGSYPEQFLGSGRYCGLNLLENPTQRDES